MAIAHAQEAQQLGAQGVLLLLPHYLTEVSQQGLAAHVEAVYRSVSLGENSQLAGKAARPPARSSFHQWLATDGKARKWTVLAIWDDDTKVSELSGSREPNLDNFRPLAEFAPIERVKDTAGASGRRSKVKSVRLIA